jgi:Fe-Mn family superoxide dismutase
MTHEQNVDAQVSSKSQQPAAPQLAGPELSRRGVLAAMAGAGALLGATGAALAQPGSLPPSRPLVGAPGVSLDLGGWDDAKGEFVLPKLPYEPKALEPHIDAQTMELHHGRHHNNYVTNANRALRMLADIRDGGDAALVRHWARELSFNLGGHINHSLFWKMLAPAGQGKDGVKGGGKPEGSLARAIDRDFGSYDKFVAHFKANAVQVESNGWGWLLLEPMSKRLMIVQMSSQQDRWLTGGVPILGVDVWEHAYYLKYQNKRSDYVDAFMNVINWEFCGKLFDAASK